MSKKQVILMSFVVAVPAIGLLVAIVMNGMAHGGNMFSGLMTAVIVVTALLVLFLGLGPFVLMGLYPAEGFAALAPPPESSQERPGTDADDELDDDGEFDDDDDDGFDDDEEDSFGDDGDGDDDGEELFDDGFDDDEFDDDDDDWE